MQYESDDPLVEDQDSDDSLDSLFEEPSGDTSKSYGLEAGMMRAPTPYREPSLLSRMTRALTPEAVANVIRRPAVNKPRPEITIAHAEVERRSASLPPATAEEPAGLFLGEQSASGTRFTPIKSVQIRSPSGLTPRARTVEPEQLAKRPIYTPRNFERPKQTNGIATGIRGTPLRPNRTPNGPVGSAGSRWVSQRAAPEPEMIDADIEAGNDKATFVDQIKALPWNWYALGVLGAVLALAFAIFAASAAPLAVGGLRNFAGRFCSGNTSSITDVEHINLRSRVANVELGLNDIQQFVHRLGPEVPDYVVVSRSPSGSMDVPKQFWDAIISRIRNDGPSIEWDTFVEHNQQRLQLAMGTEAAVIRQDLLQAIDGSFSTIASDFDAKLRAHTQSLLEEARLVATAEAKRTTLEASRFRSLALTNLISNIELQASAPNFFSPGLGATILSGLTSPTPPVTSVVPPLLTRILQRFIAPVFTSMPNPPLAALSSWDEPGDCWCTARDDTHTGRAQLGVLLGAPLYPTQLTIEHLPSGAAPADAIASAPRDVELWVQTDEPALMRFGFDGERCEDGPEDEGWQCLGRVRYDRDAPNHVQTFLLDGQVQAPVTNVLVRVTRNWGADHTCLYRVKLGGKAVGEVDGKDVA